VAGQAGANGFRDRGIRPYRKRRPIPAIIVISALGLAAVFVWVNAIVSRTDIDAVIRCDPPPTPAAGVTFITLRHDALDDRAPIPPDKVAVKVLNASSVRGQGSITTEALRAIGFTQIAPPDNDPAYAGRDAICHGQIRFGDNGTAAARTLSLVVPCAELVKDNRKDATVDLTIGTKFGDLSPTPEATKVLQQLQTWPAQHKSVVDQTLLASARNVSC
jgi:uncharacterized membrane protein (UPF0136 family)